MMLKEWREVQKTTPATQNQRGALHHEFTRLGYQDNRWDRPARLGAAAVLLGLDQLDSLRDLVMGQAGQLLRALQELDSRAELDAAIVPAAPAGRDRPDAPGDDASGRPRAASRPAARPDPLPLAVRQNMASLLAVQWSRLGAS